MADWRRMRIWASAHAIDDLYQGLVPATIPYFVLERHFSYAAASGLALAATVGSALPQPAVGWIADRRPVQWMSPLGLVLAAGGFGLAGTVHEYAAVWALLLASGLGVALFHPPAGRDARREAGQSATAMSYFAAGRSVGFFLVLIKLGQDYLPSRPGTAAGVTLGLAVSAGGLLMPALGVLADHHGPAAVLTVLGAVPALAFALSSGLREPAEAPTAPILERSVERREEEP